MTQNNLNETLSTCISIAVEAHASQFDRGGNPYILHPLTVMYRLREAGYDIYTQCIGVLHDVMEDCQDWTRARLLERGVPELVVDSLELMTHNDSVEYFDYIEGMRNDIRCLRVKLEDISHNSDIRRLKGLRQKDFARLERYSKAYVLVKKLIENIENVEQFKKEIL